MPDEQGEGLRRPCRASYVPTSPWATDGTPKILDGCLHKRSPRYLDVFTARTVRAHSLMSYAR